MNKLLNTELAFPYVSICLPSWSRVVWKHQQVGNFASILLCATEELLKAGLAE